MPAMDSPPFILQCLAGDATPADVDAFVARWTEADSDTPLGDYLGMTEDEYDAWVEFPAVLPAIIESHRTGATLIVATTELAATARGRHQHHLADAAAWLLLRDLEDDTAAS